MHRARSARDAGLEKIRQIDRWMIAGSIALTLAFSAAAAQAFKGHSRTATPSASQSAVSAPSGGGDPNAASTDPNAASTDPNAGAVPDQSQQVPVVPAPVVTASS